MKKTSLLFLFCLRVIATMYSQIQNEFVLEKDYPTSNPTIHTECKKDGRRLATVVFYTAIDDVEFETIKNDRIMSQKYDKKMGCYVLCLNGVDEEWRHIQIDIRKAGFRTYQMDAIEIKNGEYMAYKLFPKYDESKKDNVAQITVYGKNGDPLEGAKLTDKNTGKSELTNSEGVGRISFEKEGQTIYITVSHPSYSDTLNKIVQAGDNPEYTLSKYSPIKPQKVYNAFVTINYAYDIVLGTHSAGISGGKLLFCKKRLGLFLSGSTTFPMETTFIGKCDKEGYLEDGSRPNYVDSQITQWSVLGGIYWRLFDKFYLKGGLGVGVRNVYWQTEDNYYYRNLGYSKTGLALTGGVQYHVNNLVLSLDMVTNSFRTADLKIGLGYSF